MKRFRIAGLTGVAFIVLAFAGSAATVSFTYTVSGGATLTGPPAPGVPVGVLLFASSAAFTPFGNADYSEEGLITFQIFPSGAFAPTTVSNTFNASFNGGADTFFGTDEFLFSAPDPTGLQTTTSIMTILGGTGIFAGASGFGTATGNNSPPPPGELSPVYFSGGGQITAPGLAAVPEPMSVVLVAAGLTGLIVLRARRRVLPLCCLAAAMTATTRLHAQPIHANSGCMAADISGVWDTRVTPRGAPAGTRSLASVALFGRDGAFTTTIDTALPPIPAVQALGNVLGPGYGQWRRISPLRFRLVFYAPILNNGVVNGFQRVRDTITLSDTGRQYTSPESHVEFLDLNWNVVFSGASMVTGTRLESPSGCRQEEC